MADSTNNIPQIYPSQAQHEAIANSNFAMCSPAMLYGIKSIAALTLTLLGGKLLIAGVPTAVADQPLTLDPSDTLYVYYDETDGAIDFATSIPTDWPEPNGGNVPLYTVVTGASTVTSYTDHRAFLLSAAGVTPTDVAPRILQFAVSDETTDITTGDDKIYIRAPYAMTVTGVRASLSDASSSGAVTVDIKKNGTTILSTKITIDSGDKTSLDATTPPVVSVSSIADDDEIAIDIDGAGTDAKGLKITIIGTPP